jgi:hypothetical protein
MDCGKKWSQVRDLPTFNSHIPAYPTNASTGHLRPLLIRHLEWNPEEFWGYQQGGAIITIGYHSKKDPAAVVRFRNAIRKAAFAALRDNDPASIDILAVAILPQRLQQVPYPGAEEYAVRGKSVGVIEQQRLMREQFQAMFSLDEAGLDAAFVRGREGLRSAEFADVNEYVEQGKRQRYVSPLSCETFHLFLLPPPLFTVVRPSTALSSTRSTNLSMVTPSKVRR